MSIVRGNEILYHNIYDGRNREWFDNLMGRGWDEVYDELPSYSWDDTVPADLKDKYDPDIYYGHRMITVKDFKDWFQRYKPHIHAGWVTTFEKWKIENKGWIPDEPRHYLTKEDVVADMCFMEYINEYDCSFWLYKFLIKEKTKDDDKICYCFDS